MDSIVNVKFIQRLSYALDASFLVIHIAFLGLFWSLGVTPMAYFNVFSVVFYLASFIAIRRELLAQWLLVTYLEVLAHMGCAVFFVGWDCGFQITLIGITFALFFSEYVVSSVGLRVLPSMSLSILSGVVYLALIVLQSFFPPAYNLPENVELGLHFAIAAITFVMVISTLRLLTYIAERSERVLSEQATHDKLTGLPNRYFMSEFLNDKLAEEDRNRMWLAMVDIDDFKTINDTYGHVCGDEVLKALADALSSFDPNIMASRFGGEEFLLAGTSAGDMESARESLDRLRTAIAGHTIWHGDIRLNLTVTIGAAPYEPGTSVVEWVNAADQKLYYGKTHGKNQVVI